MTHMWVQMTYVPVQVEEGANDTLNVFVSNDAEAISQEQALLGCWFCHTPLNTITYATECIAESNIAQSLDKPTHIE